VNKINVLLDIIHRPVFISIARRFGDWILSSSSGGTYIFGPESIELVPIPPSQDRIYNQAQHKSSARVKTNIKNIKKIHTHEA
jgi:hypothetical protein